ncbi:MAG: ADP-ribosylglycohydrolase family protein [Rhodocyclaceae bacterium]|nr:ADP-ribosylglycohydrolase family protein [Rhodocyclaceae bacterium]
MVNREMIATPTEAPIVARLRTCFLGGAVGDALGAAVEFMRRSEILATFGPDGIRDMAPCYGKVGGITDDTQMALFTAEGLIRARVRAANRGISHPPSVISYAYQRWLYTQDATHPLQKSALDGWLIEQSALFSRRAPGNTCLSALRAMQRSGQAADNNSKGCGGVMRVAPVGMFFAARDAADLGEPNEASIAECIALGSEVARLTHGHPSGYLSAGAFSVLIYLLLANRSLNEACDAMLDVLEQQPSHEETSRMLRDARRLARECPDDPEC